MTLSRGVGRNGEAKVESSITKQLESLSGPKASPNTVMLGVKGHPKCSLPKGLGSVSRTATPDSGSHKGPDEEGAWGGTTCSPITLGVLLTLGSLPRSVLGAGGLGLLPA